MIYAILAIARREQPEGVLSIDHHDGRAYWHSGENCYDWHLHAHVSNTVRCLELLASLRDRNSSRPWDQWQYQQPGQPEIRI